MSNVQTRKILEAFIGNSQKCIQVLIEQSREFEGDNNRKVHFLRATNNRLETYVYGGDHFFLRTSVEYSNPQLTLEEVEGIIAARLLEVCCNYFSSSDFHEISAQDKDEMCRLLREPPQGKIIPFLLNTDDVEPDRYSINPLKRSVVRSGQSAYPSSTVKSDLLEIDREFTEKYENKLISKEETERLEYYLSKCSSYLDMIDLMKYEHLERLSEWFGIDLCLPVIRMPLSTLGKEKNDGLMHYVIREAHRDFDSIKSIYDCMGRSMKKRTTLLTVPHSEKGFGSKRAARGRIYFEGEKLQGVRVTYKPTKLYPNAIDPSDISIADAEDEFIVDGRDLVNYEFEKTPSSPQFVLYSLVSPENASLWHGIGEFGSSELVKSYTSVGIACTEGTLFSHLGDSGNLPFVPLQFSITPESTWFHPRYKNIDASIGCVDSLEDLVNVNIKLEFLATSQYHRG